MEKVAIPIWNDRVSPVLDSAVRLRVFEIDDNKELKSELLNLPQTHFSSKAKYISELQIDVILCGAISKPLSRILSRYGINIFPWITGDVEDVIQAYMSGELANERFTLPGCHCRQRIRSGRHNRANINPNENQNY